jgi:hypothetical protein
VLGITLTCFLCALILNVNPFGFFFKLEY